MSEIKSVFHTLNEINVNDRVEKKGKLSYLSWAWAWRRVKDNYPDAFYTIYEDKNGMNYHTDGRTCWVKTGVTINGLEHIEYLPVMNNQNKSILLEQVTSFNVNTAIQRSLTKRCARHGLGLYIYAGEDLPEAEQEQLPDVPAGEIPVYPDFIFCANCGKQIPAGQEHIAYKGNEQAPLCDDCYGRLMRRG